MTTRIFVNLRVALNLMVKELLIFGLFESFFQPKSNIYLPNIARAVVGLPQTFCNFGVAFAFLLRESADAGTRAREIERFAVRRENGSVFERGAVDRFA